METIRGSAPLSDTGEESALGKSTSTPCIRSGAVAIKITSSTNITSM
jgi:hypothetical protein